MAHLSLFFFGAFLVSRDGQPVVGFESAKVRALLAYLAVEADRPHRREALASLLWPEAPEATARTNLRQALANLRLVLDKGRADSPCLLVNRETVQFNLANGCWLDVAVFAGQIAACASHAHRHAETCNGCADRHEQAVGVYRGGFLDEFFLSDSAVFEEWAALKREHFHQQALSALARLSDYYERREMYADAQKHVRRQIELDLWDEQAHQRLMRLLWQNGQRSAALAQYIACRRVLREELGVEPAAKTIALYERLQRGEAEPTHQVESPRSNLAAHTFLTPFLGRKDDLARITEGLDLRDCQLLTLVGPGGVGKTRLALAAAAKQLGSFRDGVYVVPLAPLNSAAQLANAIVTALGLRLGGSEPLNAQLLAHLFDKELLLILDNVEHLLPSVDDIRAILKSAPLVKLLVTSREPLDLHGEWKIVIEGMKFPQHATAASIESYSAIQLFVQTALRVKTTFTLSPEVVASVARICKLVEGLPLAIELAAAWVRTHSYEQIAREIERSLDYLATTMRDVPKRHRNIRAVFAYSWKQLPLDAQLLFQ